MLQDPTLSSTTAGIRPLAFYKLVFDYGQTVVVVREFKTTGQILEAIQHRIAQGLTWHRSVVNYDDRQVRVYMTAPEEYLLRLDEHSAEQPDASCYPVPQLS